MESIHFKCCIRNRVTKITFMYFWSRTDAWHTEWFVDSLQDVDWSMGLARQCRLSNEHSYWSISSLTNDNMMLILLTLIMVIFYFPHSHYSHHHHRPDHSGFLYHREALCMLPYSPTNQSYHCTEIIQIF